MIRQKWNGIHMPPDIDDYAWELFHENSKTSRYGGLLPQEVIIARMANMLESLPFEQYPVVDLPTSLMPLKLSLEEAITTRVTARSLEPCPLTLDSIATILHYAYGLNRDNKGTIFPRPFRVVPSGGALYPLELFFHSAHIKGLEPGLYHYNPTRNDLRFLYNGDLSPQLSEAMVQTNMPFDTSLLIFITAIFERSIFKYGDRGYRFILLEAGHVAQNINLVSNALGLGCVNVGGYFDRQIDDLLGLDGITQSTVYMIGIGKKLEELRDIEGLL